MISKFLLSYLKIINEASNTGLTPASLIDKIFSDIKKQDFNKSFVLIYSNDDIYKFLPKNYINKINDDFNFLKSQLKYLIILNSKIYNNINQFKVYQKKIDSIIQQINNKEKPNITKYQLYNDYLNFVQKLVDEKHINYIQTLPSNIANYIIYNLIDKFIPTLNVDKRLSLLNICNFIKKDISRIIDFVTSKQGLSINKPFSDCSLIFINNNVFQKNNLEKIYSILNHQLDHYFYYRLNDDIPISHKNEIKTEKELFEYIFEKSQIRSRITDLCNFFNHKVIPELHQKSVSSFLQFLENCYKNKIINNIQSYINQNKEKYIWLKNIDNNDKDTLKVACIYFYKDYTKKYLIDRITKECEIYMKKYNNAKYRFKYSQSLKRKFNLK